MNKKILILLPALVLMLNACGNTPNRTSTSKSGETTDSSTVVETVESVQISQTEATLDVGETVQLTAVAKPSTLSEKGVNWSTSAAAVATVSAGGLVTAVAEGTATITAASKLDATKTATCTVTVNKEMVTVVADAPDATKTYKFGLYQENLKKTLYLKGEDETGGHLPSVESWGSAPDVTVEDAGDNTYYVKFGNKYLNTPTDYHARFEDTKTTKWSWSAEHKTFVVTPPNATEQYFIGTYNNYDTFSSCKLSMIAGDFVGHLMYQVEPCDPQTITIDQGATAEVYAGSTLQLSATLGPVGAVGTVAWAVTGNDKVTVSEAGLVTVANDAVAGSTATVTASCGELSAQIVITITEPINYGSETEPLTIAEAKAVLDITGAAKTAEELWVKGYVYSNTLTGTKTAGTSKGTIWLTNDDGSVAKEFELYNAFVDDAKQLTEQAAGAMVGKEIVAHGYGTIYGTTYELTPNGDSNPTIVSISSANPRAVTGVQLSVTEAFEMEQGDEKAVSAELLPYAATGTIDYAIAPAEQGVRYEHGKIIVDSDATGGQYTLTATAHGTDKSASVNFTVNAADPSVLKTTLDITEYANETHPTSGTTKFTSVTLDEVVTISVSGTDSNTGKMYGPGNDTGLWEVRCYASGNGTLNISVAAGYELVSASGVIGKSNWAAGAEEQFTVTDNAVAYNNGGANFNIKSVTVAYKPVAAQEEVAYPEGSFKGTATVAGNDYSIVIAIGAESQNLVAVRLANKDAVPTGITFNKVTGAFEITTTGAFQYSAEVSLTYGKITGVYDAANNKLVDVTCDGSIGAYVSNNGHIEATDMSAGVFYNCEGTTAELQNLFKRRYMSGSWQVDNSNANRIERDEAHFVGGAASAKWKGWTGGAVSMSLKEDWATAKELQNLHFWVYNPSESDVTLRIWIYKGTGMNNNAEQGGMVAKAGQWSYYSMGFCDGSNALTDPIYNFQIADFTNSGVFLSFDNIALF